MDVLALFNEQISGLTQEDNEKQHHRKRLSAKTVVQIFSTLLVPLHIRLARVSMTCSWSKSQAEQTQAATGCLHILVMTYIFLSSHNE